MWGELTPLDVIKLVIVKLFTERNLNFTDFHIGKSLFVYIQVHCWVILSLYVLAFA